MIYKNGDRYEGNFKDELLEGNGTYYWKNGDKYVGQLKNNQENGFGALVFSTKSNLL